MREQLKHRPKRGVPMQCAHAALVRRAVNREGGEAEGGGGVVDVLHHRDGGGQLVGAHIGARREGRGGGEVTEGRGTEDRAHGGQRARQVCEDDNLRIWERLE